MEKSKIFAVISIVSAILTIPTFAIDSTLSILENEAKEEREFLEKLDYSKNVLERCEFSNSQRDNISRILFDSEREVRLNGDLDKAKKLFAEIEMDLIECEPGIPFQTYELSRFSYAVFIMPLILISIVFAVLWITKRQKKK